MQYLNFKHKTEFIFKYLCFKIIDLFADIKMLCGQNLLSKCTVSLREAAQSILSWVKWFILYYLIVYLMCTSGTYTLLIIHILDFNSYLIKYATCVTGVLSRLPNVKVDLYSSVSDRVKSCWILYAQRNWSGF